MRVLTEVFHGFSTKFKASDIASSVSKAAPEFCNVYIIAKGKISSLRSATSSPGPNSRLHMQHSQSSHNSPSFNHLDARFTPSTRGLTYPPYMCILFANIYFKKILYSVIFFAI